MIADLESILIGNSRLKLKRSLDKNPDFQFFRSGQYDSKLSMAPLNDVDIERSFSDLKNIFTARRTSFKPENLEKYLTYLFLSYDT